jgi:hypothetical protein
MSRKTDDSSPNAPAQTSRREFIARTLTAAAVVVIPTALTSTPAMAALVGPKGDERVEGDPEASASPKPFPDASQSALTPNPSSSPAAILPSPSHSPLPPVSQAPTRSRTRDAVQQPQELQPKSPKAYDFF